ncbi:MAG: type VI secretion system protein TssA [bacterium]|nr:type VI secretion system protein TssA [bacterium]
MNDISSDLIQAGIQPISPDSPAGALLGAEDADFEQLQTEIRKLDSFTREPVDWHAVVSSGGSILTRKSKDLRVLSYLCLGLFDRQGYAGLSIGLTVYRDLIENFWETLYPALQRKRGRIGAITWLSEKVGAKVSQDEPTLKDKEAINKCNDLLKRITELIDDKLGEDSPGLSDLQRPIREHLKALESLEPPKVEPSAPSKPEEPASPDALPAKKGIISRAVSSLLKPEEIGSVEEANKAIREAQGIIRRAASFLRESDPANPLPYRISRAISWMSINSLPNNNNGRTFIPPPPDKPERYEQALLSGNAQAILAEAEARFSQAFYWLDLQRFVVQAFSALGPAYQKAQQAVCQELRSFLSRLPGLIELQFQSGLPFANDQTKLWIKNEILPAKTGESPPEGEAEQDQLKKAVKEAGRLVFDGKLREAVVLLQEGLEQRPVRRDRFLWRLSLARLCLEAGQPQLAAAQLESLDEESRRFSLEEWEPGLCLEVVRSLLQCQYKLIEDLKKRPPPPELTERVNQLYARLCKLDVVSALEFKG